MSRGQPHQIHITIHGYIFLLDIGIIYLFYVVHVNVLIIFTSRTKGSRAPDIKSARLLSNPKIEHPAPVEVPRCNLGTSDLPHNIEVRGCDIGLLSGLLLFRDLIFL